MEKIKPILSKLYIFIFVFIFIYSPRLFSKYDPIIVLTLISIVSLLVFYRTETFSIIKNKKLVIFGVGLVLSILYLIIIVFKTSKDLLIIYRFAVIILQVLPCVFYLCFYFKKKNYTIEKLCKLLISISFFQSILCLSMFTIAPFRQFVLNILIKNDLFKFMIDANMWTDISSHRIYGITANYTFNMPIFQAFVAVIVLIMGLKYSIKYFMFIPTILFSSIINARTGLFVFVIMSFISIVFLVTEKDKNIYKRLFLLIVFLIICAFAFIIFIRSYSPVAYQWLTNSIAETFDLIAGRNRESGTFVFLIPMFFLPKGLALIFGTGSDVFLVNNYNINGRTSDIGYVNDIFIGGLFFIILLYGTFIVLALNSFKRGSLERILSVILVATLLFVNIKGAIISKSEFLNMYILVAIAMIVLDKVEVNPQKVIKS